jgi:hypothetical protein
MAAAAASRTAAASIRRAGNSPIRETNPKTVMIPPKKIQNG